MAKRKRDVPLLFWVSPEEKALIQKKMEQIGSTNLSAYLRKMAIDGYVVNLELPELREMVSLLRRSSNNLNQLTRRVHETGRFYPFHTIRFTAPEYNIIHSWTRQGYKIKALHLETKLYNQGTMTFYAHENVENLGVYIFSCSFTRALICGKIIINDVVSVQPQKEIEMKTTDINKVRYTNRWRIVYGICNN